MTPLLFALAACAPSGSLPADRLPVSTSSAEIPPAEAVVSADAAGYRVDGAPAGRLGAGAGLGAPEVEAALRARAAEILAAAAGDPDAPAFRGAFSLEVDRDLPARAVLELVDGAAKAGFGRPWLVVVDRAGERHGVRLGAPPVAVADALAEEEGEQAAGAWANPRLHLDASAGYRVGVADAVVDPGRGLLVACDARPCGAAWPDVELGRLLRRVKLDHPRDRSILVAPDLGVSVQALVGALDAAREDRRARELFPVAYLTAPFEEAP